MSKPSLVRRILSAIWTGITRIRLALSNLLFLAMLALIYFVYMGGMVEPLPEKAALLLNVSGRVVDQKAEVNPLRALMGRPSPTDHEVLLRDVIESVELAAADPAINSLVMDLDFLVHVGISRTQEIAEALETFRATGKPIIAIGDYYTQDQFLLASHADTVISHPMGGVALEGYSSYQNYFRDALEKISVNVHVFRAGEHKSVAEPFLRNDMSPDERELTLRWLNNLWGQYTTMVEARRKLPAGAVNDYINNFAGRLQGAGGDAAELALRAGLVDKLLGRVEGNQYLVDIVGATNKDGLYEAVEFERYVSRKRPLSLRPPKGDRVAVITAAGNIVPGDQPPGTIGGDSLARMVRAAIEADGVKAIVLRVASGGGSMFASEIIRQELLRARAAGKPVVVSMGAIAASGGYYIAAEADEIWATPTTITGSIGVFAAFPTFEELLGRLGIHTDGVGTTRLAGSLRADRPLHPDLVDALNSSVEFAYRSFVDIVATGRDMTPEHVDTLAQGRVWSATDALRHGLIDKLGSLDDAVAAAAARAGMTEYEVHHVQPPLSPRDLFLKQLARNMGALNLWPAGEVGAVFSGLLLPLREATQELGSLQDPRHLYMRCLACGPVR